MFKGFINKYLIALFFAIFISFSVNAIAEEKSSISGFVKDSVSKETLIGATVYLKNTKSGTRTNKNGYYVITDVPAGKYKLIVSCVGYQKLEREISLSKGESDRIDLELKSSSVTTDAVTVEADREVEKRQITISKINIPVAQIKNIRVGGESDVFRSLQFLPGILTSSQISSGLFVRGGSPDQNLVLLDGATVYNPTHLFGFISTFNTDAIKDVELIKGGFEAQYGGRLSAVLNITQKDGNRDHVEGLASLGVLSSRASLEGPLGNGSWCISGRRTYFELIKSMVKENPESPLPDFNFYDVNAKITQDFGSNDKLALSGFISSDNLGYESFGINMDLGISNKLGAARWTHIFSPKVFAVTSISASEYINDFNGDNSGYGFLIENSITDYTGKLGLEWFASDAITNKFGIEVNNYHFKYLQDFSGDTDSTASGSSAGRTNLKVEDWNYALYAQSNIRPDDFISFQLGGRAQYWKLSDEMTYDWRLAARYQLNDEMAVKAAVGTFHQNLRLAGQPDLSFFDTWLPTDSTISPCKSNHYILSVETKPTEDTDLNFDIYYKTFDNINEVNTTAMQGSTVSDVFFVGSANAWGAEVFYQKRIGNFTGWAGYALGFVKAKFDSINSGKEFSPKYDRTHDFKVVGNYILNETWEFGATFSFQTGQPYTGATSRGQSYLDGQNYGRGKIFVSQRNGLRLPPSHQLNVNASYKFTMFDLPAKLILDIYNVYNRRDIWFRYYNTRQTTTTVEDVRLIPILPTLSFEVKF